MSKRIITAIALAVIGILLLLIRVDRTFIELAPTEGVVNTVTLESDKTYEQTFIVNRRNVSRLGVYVRPVVEKVPNASFTVEAFRGDTKLLSQTVPAVFTAPDSASNVRFSPALPTTPGEELTLRISVPKELSKKLGVETRIQDETFNRDAKFFIDGQLQDNPMGYFVYYSWKPAFSIYAGAMILLAAVMYALRMSIASARGQLLYAIALPIIVNIPLAITGDTPYILIIIQIAILYAVLHGLKGTFKILPVRLFVSHAITFSSWLPLVFIASRPIFQMPGLAVAKDIFLDPNQIALSTLGSYIGFPALAFAIIGFVAVWRKHAKTVAITATALIGAGLFLYAPLGGIAVALLAGRGFTAMITFLGKDNALVRLISYVLVYLALVDIWIVYSRIFEMLLV